MNFIKRIMDQSRDVAMQAGNIKIYLVLGVLIERVELAIKRATESETKPKPDIRQWGPSPLVDALRKHLRDWQDGTVSGSTYAGYPDPEFKLLGKPDSLVIIEGEKIEGVEAILVAGARAVFLSWSDMRADPAKAKEMFYALHDYFESQKEEPDENVNRIFKHLVAIIEDAGLKNDRPLPEGKFCDGNCPDCPSSRFNLASERYQNPDITDIDIRFKKPETGSPLDHDNIYPDVKRQPEDASQS